MSKKLNYFLIALNNTNSSEDFQLVWYTAVNQLNCNEISELCRDQEITNKIKEYFSEV